MATPDKSPGIDLFAQAARVQNPALFEAPGERMSNRADTTREGVGARILRALGSCTATAFFENVHPEFRDSTLRDR